MCSWWCLWRGIGVHIAANRCSGHRPSSLAMTPRVWWILSVPGRSCGLLLSQPLFCLVGLSSTGSTKPCRVGISYMANLYAAVWSRRVLTKGFVRSGNVFEYVTLMFVLGVELQDWKLQMHAQYRKLWKYDRPLAKLFFSCDWKAWKSSNWRKSLFFSLYLSLSSAVCLSNSHPQLCLVWLMAAIH